MRNVAPKPNHKRRPNFNQANPAAYHWGEYDLLISRAVAMHWKVLLTVSGPVPNWATPHGEDRYSYPNTTDFEQFMQADETRTFHIPMRLLHLHLQIHGGRQPLVHQLV